MKVIIPEIKGIGLHRLGRNINHDPRSLLYLAAPATVDKTVSWKRRVPIFDQGDLGSCTGNAEVGVLGTDPFYDTFDRTVRDHFDEDFAVEIYSEATKIDPYAGTYPPDDTGSDGLSVSKVALAKGLIKGYMWAINLDQAKTLIQQGPFIIGTQWTSNMDRPDANGFIANPCGGSVRGGHEYECYARDAITDRWYFCNSWGGSWGNQGTFSYDSNGLAGLLQRGGDITQSVPLDKPAPEPVPTDDPDLAAWWTICHQWAAERHWSDNRYDHTVAGRAALASRELAKKKGLL